MLAVIKSGFKRVQGLLMTGKKRVFPLYLLVNAGDTGKPRCLSP